MIAGGSAAVVIAAYFLGAYSGNFLAQRKQLKDRQESTETALYRMNTIEVGAVLPNYALEDMQGRSVQLLNLLQSRSVITFFYPDCDACLEEFEKLGDAISNNSDYKYFIFISRDNPDELLEFVDLHGINANIYYDRRGVLTARLKVFVYPFNIVTDEMGVIREIIVDQMTTEELGEIIEYNNTTHAAQ